MVGAVAGVESLDVVCRGFRVVRRQRFPRHAVLAVHPLRQILELATLAAERLPLRLDRVASAEHADTRGHGHIL